MRSTQMKLLLGLAAVVAILAWTTDAQAGYGYRGGYVTIGPGCGYYSGYGGGYYVQPRYYNSYPSYGYYGRYYNSAPRYYSQPYYGGYRSYGDRGERRGWGGGEGGRGHGEGGRGHR